MRIFDRKSAGLLIPLFSIRTGEEWGVGEYPDLVTFAKWARTGGFRWLLTLPLLEPSPGQESPYSSASFFALDPLYIALRDVPEFQELGGISSLDGRERLTLDAVSASASVDHAGIRWLKGRVLARCFEAFEAAGKTERRASFDAFVKEQAAWLEPYVLFRTLKEANPESWRAWPEGLRNRTPSVINAFKTKHARSLEFRRYLQWTAFTQLEAARQGMHEAGVALAGDEPFLVADDSADVWANREGYRFDATVGAPPDAFSADGQEWGLPPYKWDALKKDHYALFAARGAHTARLYDAVRIDHVVGLYRTYHRPIDKSEHFFYPDVQADQLAQGEAVLEAFRKSGTEILAEDLGVIPPFVRLSLQRLGIPGYRVFRWEQEQGRFRDPETWPELSVATTGTHDTESMIDWWQELPEWERKAALALPKLREAAPTLDAVAGFPSGKDPGRMSEAMWRALLATVIESPSRAVLLPVQDVLRVRDRINTPNTVGPENWSHRLSWTVSALADDSILRGRMRIVRAYNEASGRV